ncbi:putative uncharacterized protein DDB_G0286901 [Ostrinia furnacalis]|uniref:putative uncharacterized protein DDB_G0286901 n=1 Tax=Ostrinia furnacalis TaxID=93504 RepID=UPI00103DF8A1|nr:putative uncharacterized protein DDB_G0286901 [Ostrinia furnacalis]
MWKYVVFVCLPISWATAQNGRTSAHQEHGHGWDIRLAVPGEPGSDYPTLGAIPRTSFSCAGKAPGYYADLETNCQVFRVCTLGSTYGFQSFLCPNGTLFNQAVFVCDWWMNVKCQESAQLFNNNNEKFGNLRLGPQLMKDIKKMLTHPMRNPYDKTAMKSNLVVMQDYKPPFGQLFPNGALIAGPERPPNNIYVPAKQVQFSQNNFGGNDIAFAASTPDPRYLPAAFNNGQRDAEVFQRQRQYGQYAQNQRLQNAPGTVISNGHAGQFTQMISNANLLSTRPTQSYNNGIVQYGQRQLSNTRPTPSISTQNAINIQRGQLNQLNSQYTNYQNPARLNSGKQLSFGEPLTNQQYNSNQVRQPYTYQQPPLQFSNEINGKVGNEAKQNLALVFSLLADSINVAKEYSNTAHQEQSAQLRAPIQNINNDDLAHITNKISQLTSSQYSGNNQAYKSANIVSTVQTTTKDQGYQYRDSGTNNLSQNQIQSSQRVQNNYGSTQTTNQPQSARLQSGTGVQYNTVQSNSKQVYSGQLYQLPVPEVTNQYYNGQNNGNVQSSKIQQQENFSSQNNNVVSSNNNNRAPDGDVEIIKSQSIPITSGKLQASPTTELDEFNSQENFSKFISTNNGISAQLQDKIVGTINHPLSDNKLVTYKKDESYYVYTKLDNSFPQNIQTNGNLVQLNIDGSQKSAKLTQGNDFPNVVAFQFIPSVSYQLEDEKEQQKILNAFQIDEFGSPKQKLVQTSSVDYSVDHTPSAKQFDRQFNEVNNLYAGPSSYSAPQSSVGKLQSRQDNVNARLELEENNNGYSKVVPSRQFTF